MDFFQDYVDSCGIDKKIATIPVRVRWKILQILFEIKLFNKLLIARIEGHSLLKYKNFQFNTPVYGPPNPNFTDFAAPGVILT